MNSNCCGTAISCLRIPPPTFGRRSLAALPISAIRTEPFRGDNPVEPYAFVNFADLDGYFDEVKIWELPYIGGYESDNHTVGYIAPPAIEPLLFSISAIPEPTGLSLLGFGLAIGSAAYRRWPGCGPELAPGLGIHLR